MAGERKHTVATSPRRIFLEPGCVRDCDGASDRLWCEDDVWGECEDCGAPSVGYVREDTANDLLEALEEARREIKALHRELPVKPARYELDVLEKIDAAINRARATGGEG